MRWMLELRSEFRKMVTDVQVMKAENEVQSETMNLLLPKKV